MAAEIEWNCTVCRNVNTYRTKKGNGYFTLDNLHGKARDAFLDENVLTCDHCRNEFFPDSDNNGIISVNRYFI